MGLRLGRIEEGKITLKSSEGDIVIHARWRDPKASEFLEFRKRFSALQLTKVEPKDGDDEPTSKVMFTAGNAFELTHAYADLAVACLIDVSDLEDTDGNPVKGKEAIALLQEYGDGLTLLEGLGQRIFERMRTLEARAGKGERASDSS